jgi:DtxR family Mn-dependent transcriptional regulator
MVVHVEDEPETVFRELASKGFQPGVRIRVVSRSDRSVDVEIRDAVVSLPLLTASNVTVIPAPPVAHAATTLETVSIGHSARVVGIDDACRGIQRRRMLDLGLVPGTIVTAELPSPGGDPVAYRIRGSLIALRHAQASLILVEQTEAKS